MTTPRLPPLPPEQWTPPQREAEADFRAVRKVGLSGPFEALLRSPELLTHAQRMGEFLRYRCSLAGRLSELAILVIAREWSQDYEFATHSRHAAQAGVTAETIAAIADGRRPKALESDETAIFDFVDELLRRRRVSDASYAAALERFGETGVVDLCGLVGYYSLLAVTMNATRTPPPEGGGRLPRFPD